MRPPRVVRPKTRFEREKDEREARRKKEEKEAAVLYEEFAASFGSSPNAGQVLKQTEEKPPRQIDAFLEELKSRQPLENESNFAAEVDDPETTTNLYVGNLAPSVSEEALKARFEHFGPVDSVKIMWPRTDEERNRHKNCGFVSFFSRIDADEARQAMNHVEIDGYTIIVDWAKSLLAHHQDDDVPFAWHSKQYSTSDRIEIKRPVDPEQLRIIDTLAQCVSEKGGAALEASIRKREMTNPKFAFLLRSDSVQAQYYRWRVYVYIMQAKNYQNPLPPEIRIQNDGPLWICPAGLSDDCDSSYVSSSDHDESTHDDCKRLTFATFDSNAAERWLQILSELSMSRKKIAEAMCFAYDRIQYAPQLSERLVRNCLLNCTSDTSLAKRTAWFCLVSDLLANCGSSIRGSSRFKTSIQASLPMVVLKLSQALKATSSRMAANTMENRIGRVFAFWLRRAIFPPLFVHGLEATFFAPLELPISSRSTSDPESLRRKARQAGLPEEDIQIDQLLARLAHARAYVKFRTLGAEPRSANEKALAYDEFDKEHIAPPALVSIQNDDEQSSLDGEPFDAISKDFVRTLHTSNTKQTPAVRKEEKHVEEEAKILETKPIMPSSPPKEKQQKRSAPSQRDSSAFPPERHRPDEPKRYPPSRRRSSSRSSSSQSSSYSPSPPRRYKYDPRGPRHYNDRRYSRSRSPSRRYYPEQTRRASRVNNTKYMGRSPQRRESVRSRSSSGGSGRENGYYHHRRR